MPAITDKFNKYSNGSQPLPTTLSAQKLTGASSASLTSATGWDTSSVKFVRMYQTTTSGGQTIPDQSTLAYYKGTLSGTTLSDLTLIWSASGSDPTYPAGTTVDLSVSAGWTDALIDGLTTSFDQDGTLKADAVDVSAVIKDGVVTRPKLATAFADEIKGGWLSGDLPAVSTVVANGNRSYTMTFASDVSSILSEGMRLRTTRTTATTATCFSLDGSNDYFNKTSPAGMTFTDDFAVSAWVYLTSYGSAASIVSRWNGTSGWDFEINSVGQVLLFGTNAGAANISTVNSYQSIPLNKWVHVAAQLDMSTFTATTTTSYIMIDGKDVPAAVSRGGTNPTALVQAGNLEVGSRNGGLQPFPGYLKDICIYNAKVTQATILDRMHQTPTGSETNLISAYTGANTTDLNTTNANNLTAQNGAVSGFASAPYGNRGVSTTLDYGLVMAVSGSSVTVQVPEGCTIPTTGGVSAVAYSTQSAPYGFVTDKGRWSIQTLGKSSETVAIGGLNTYYSSNQKLTVPTGKWELSYSSILSQNSTVSGSRSGFFILSYTSTWVTSGELVSRLYQKPSGDIVMGTIYRKANITLSTETIFSLFGGIDIATGTETWAIRGDQGTSVIQATPAGLGL